MRCSDSQSPIRFRFVSFGYSYRRCASSSLPAGKTRVARGPGAFSTGFPAPVFRRRRRLGLPGSWGNLNVRMPCSKTPAGRECQARIALRRSLPLQTKLGLHVIELPTWLPQTSVDFEAQSHGLHTRCLRFAARVSPGPRKTRSRVVASLPGRAFTRKIPYERFQLDASSLPRLSLAQVCPTLALSGRCSRKWPAPRQRDYASPTRR